MSAGTVTGVRDTDAVPAGAGRAVSRLAVRQVRRGGLIVVAVAAGMPAFVAGTYDQVMADPAAAGGLDALAGNPAIRTLFGEPVGLGTAGGFTVWRVGTPLAVLLGVWSILAATRTTRGEEDAGRWDVLLAGRLTLPTIVARHLAAVAFVPVASGLAVAAALLLAGTAPAGAVLHGAGVALLGLFFVAVAGLAAQAFPARATATGTAVAVLGASLLARMIGDGVAGLGWLRWLSPFGLLELSSPYAGNRPAPPLILLAAVTVVWVAAFVASGRRDVGGGLMAVASRRRARLGLLATVEGFAIRRVLWPLAAWSAGVVAYFLLIGLTSTSITDFLSDNPAFADLAAQAGFAGLGTVKGFAATLFALLAVPVGGFTAVRLAAFVAAESAGRLTLLAAQPVGRVRLLVAELAATLGGALVVVTAAGFATWCGAVAVDADLALPAALWGTWNVLPIVLLSLGAAALAVGWVPRAAALAGSLPGAGGFLFLVIAESVGAPGWVRGLSPFAHLAPVPSTAADWPAALVMTGIAVILAVAGVIGYRRRDLSC